MIRDGVTFTVDAIFILLLAFTGWVCAYRRERREGFGARCCRWRALVDSLTYALLGLTISVTLLTRPEVEALVGAGWPAFALSMTVFFVGQYLSLLVGLRAGQAIERRLEEPA